MSWLCLVGEKVGKEMTGPEIYGSHLMTKPIFLAAIKLLLLRNILTGLATVNNHHPDSFMISDNH